MSQQIAEFYAVLKADISGLQKGLDDANKKLDSTGKQAGKTGGAMGSLSSQLGGLINPATLAAGALTGLTLYLRNSVKAADESARVDAKLAAVLKATGNAAGLTTDDIDDMSSSMSKLTGIDDEVVKGGAAVLATFREIGGDVFPQAMQAALDMSAVMGQDLQSSIVQIGKALNDPIAGVTALQRVGVKLTDQQKEQIKAFMEAGDVASAQAVILQELQMEFGGAAEAMSAAGDGSDRTKVAMGNLAEAIGGRLFPAAQDANGALAQLANTMAEGIEASNASATATGIAGKALQQMADNHTNSLIPATEAQIAAWRTSEQAVYSHNDALASSSDAISDAKAAQEAFNAEMDELSQILDGALGDAQDDYNAKIAEYRQQLAEARTEKEKDEINGNIAAETAEYNKRAKAIAFNIQQEAIMNSQLPNDQKLSMITALGVSYGQYDEATAKLINTTQSWLSQVEEGSMSEEAFLQHLRNTTQGLMETDEQIDTSANAMYGLVDPMQHVGARAEDAAAKFLTMKDAQSQLADGINSESNPAIAGLKSNINQLQDKAVYIDIFVRKHGGGGGLAGTGNPISDLVNMGLPPSVVNNLMGGSGADTESGYSGGMLGKGWTLVGDGPGGQLTPWSELIAPWGEVIDAKRTRKLFEAGVIDGVKSMMFGGDIDSPWTFVPSKPTPSPIRRTTGRPGDPMPSTPSLPGTGEDDAVASVASQVANSVQTSVSGALLPTQQLAAAASSLNNTQLKEISNTLKQILASQASPAELAAANNVEASRYS